MSAFYFEQLEKHIDYDFSGLTDPRNMIYDLEHHKPIIEHNLYQILPYLIEKNATGSFTICIKNFYNQIVDGDYRPSPSFDIIYDIFEMTAESDNYQRFFDILYTHKFYPDNLTKKVGEDLPTRLANKNKFEAIHYLHEKYNLSLDFTGHISFWEHLPYVHNFDSNMCKKFLDLNIFQPIHRSFFQAPINNNNIDNFINTITLIKNHSKYKELFEEKKLAFFSYLVSYNDLSLVHLYKINDIFKIEKLDSNMLAQIFDGKITQKQENLIKLNDLPKNFYDKEKYNFFLHLGIKECLKNDAFDYLYTHYLKTLIIRKNHSDKYYDFIKSNVLNIQDQKNIDDSYFYIFKLLLNQSISPKDALQKISFFSPEKIDTIEKLNTYFINNKSMQRYHKMEGKVIDSLVSEIECQTLNKVLDTSAKKIKPRL